MAMHYFNTETAKEVGMFPAILLENIAFWCEKNRANEKHFYDGHYWTYNSARAFAELFPYVSKKQIETALKKLGDGEFIIFGNYNQSGYDRTKWYAVTERGYALSQKGKCILQKGEMEITKKGNGYSQNVTPIPYSKPHIKNTDEKTYTLYCQQIVDEYNRACPSLPKVLKLTKAREAKIKKFNESFTAEEITLIFQKVEASEFASNASWCSFDWLMNVTNATKVLEGNYDNKEIVVETKRPKTEEERMQDLRKEFGLV